MTKEMKVLGQYIDLGHNIKLAYQEPEVFSKYHVVYHGQKYGNYYFRNSPDMLLGKAKYIDSGYFILKDDKIVGGAFLKPNFMADLFVIPPYNDYTYIADKLLKYLKTISSKTEKILLQEIIEDYVPFYESKDCVIFEDGFWMIRPTDSINCIVPDNYEAKAVVEEYKNEIADLIIAAYTANPTINSVDSKESYIQHVEAAIENTKDNDTLYNSSKVVICKATNEVVGSCLHMEFEGLPLIMSFAVRPEHQGKGIGSYLIKNSINCSSTAYRATRLFVFNNNPAIEIYEHLGFIKNRTLNDMYLIND
ncbi:MAG: GNAT family N-acetyltransferase [Clostridium sp.]|uniref:GNAT family N-acetyltransferase n=1 Tax=Clostridium sp. TaxID=1506 RepID=UPI003D6D2C74